MASLGSHNGNQPVSERITEFLGRHHGRAFCTDCIEGELQLSKGKRAEPIAAILAFTDFYRREIRHCHGCGAEKQVISAG
jgi:hypothetical protein